MKTMITIAFCGVLALSLGACREEEQNRITLYEKGVYMGKTDQSLTDIQARRLAGRTMMQHAW